MKSINRINVLKLVAAVALFLAFVTPDATTQALAEAVAIVNAQPAAPTRSTGVIPMNVLEAIWKGVKVAARFSRA